MSSLLARLLTRSFPAKAEARTAGASAGSEAGAGDESSAGVAYESRAFRLWYESRAGGKRSPVILELGRIHADSLRFFQSAHARVVVTALDTSLSGAAFEKQLADGSQWGPFDGILCWDLPNYLETAELTSLGRWIARHSESGTMVMVCLETNTPYPSAPGQYAIQSEAELRFNADQRSPKTRRVTHSSHELVKLWSQFAAVRSFLLRTGMQEFVMRRR